MVQIEEKHASNFRRIEKIRKNQEIHNISHLLQQSNSTEPEIEVKT